MGREQTRERDERWETLKRRVIALSRLEGHVIELAEGVFVYAPARVTNVDALWDLLQEGAPPRARFEQVVELDKPMTLVTRAALATAQRDLRALAATPARALARERKKLLVRHGEIDEAWLRAKARRIDELTALLDRGASKETAFARALGIIAAVHGEASARSVAEAHGRLVAEGAARRRIAGERLEVILGAMIEGLPDPAAERLEQIGDLPGRARRTRALTLLQQELGIDAQVDVQDLADKRKPWIESLRDVGHALVRAHPSPRSPQTRASAETMLAWYGLTFASRDLAKLGPPEVKRAIEKKKEAFDLHAQGVTIEEALALVELPMEPYLRRRAAKLVAEGLEIEHVAAACSHKRIGELVRNETVRAARAFATWATKLVPHYGKLGITLELTPELFANLPRNEDLAVLAMCLVDAHFDRKESEPLSTLDATLGLFQKLPSKASSVIARLRGTDPGGGRRIFPELAEWLGEDDLLDRFVHLTRLAGQPVVLTQRLREDFDHAEKAAREQAHLEAMTVRSSRQDARLRVLRAVDRSRSAAPRGRTRRRLLQRIEELLPIAYRRELDQVFKEILREAWSIDVTRLTPAWRDAVRFWLGVDNNRDVLGQMLRAASKAPGRDVKRTFPRNEEWIEKARRQFDVDAWLAPRRSTVEGYALTIEDDPLEVLRMGIPFETCLSLTDGCNAASTIVNAVDANKRVIYVRNAEGSVVARKLIAIDKKGSLIGYNLYVSVRGGAEAAIRRAVTDLCREVAQEAGLQLSNVGDAPERLHGTFWYDDGIVAFDEDVDVASYCRALGLDPQPAAYDALVTEAKGRAAMMANDVEGALANLTRWDRGAANIALGRFVVDRLGERETMKRSSQNASLVPPLLSRLADDGVEGILRLLDLATRLDEESTAQELGEVVSRFGPDSRIARACADLAVRAARVCEDTSDDGIAWAAIDHAEARFENLPHAFDLLDRMDAAYQALNRVPGNDVDRLWCREPDGAAVIACLTSRRRSLTAHRAAIRIVSLFTVEGAGPAIERLALFRPELGFAATPARVRHGLPVVAAAPGKIVPDSFGDLLVTAPDRVAPFLDWSDVDIGTWAPGPWELAYLARHPDAGLTQRLLAEARKSPRASSRALEWLALMGDREAVREIVLAPREAGKAAQAPVFLKTCEECTHAAGFIRRQVEASSRGKLAEWELIGVTDRWHLELAMRVLMGEAEGHTGNACELVLQTKTPVPLARVIEKCIERGNVHSTSRLLGKLGRGMATVGDDMLAKAWTTRDLQDAVARSIAITSVHGWAARVWAMERAHAVSGLFERVVLQRLEWNAAQASVWEVESPDQLRSAIKVVVTEASPENVAISYCNAPDELTAAMFLKAMTKVPPERAAAIREAAKGLTWHGARGTARKAWIEATRLRETAASPIER